MKCRGFGRKEDLFPFLPTDLSVWHKDSQVRLLTKHLQQPLLEVTGHVCRTSDPSRAKAPLRLTDDVGLVLQTGLHVPPALDILLAVPPVGLLADLLPALLVDALSIADGGSAASQK